MLPDVFPGDIKCPGCALFILCVRTETECKTVLPRPTFPFLHGQSSLSRFEVEQVLTSWLTMEGKVCVNVDIRLIMLVLVFFSHLNSETLDASVEITILSL